MSYHAIRHGSPAAVALGLLLALFLPGRDRRATDHRPLASSEAPEWAGERVA